MADSNVAYLNDPEDDTDGLDPRFIEEQSFLFKVIIRGDTADELMGNLFSDKYFVLIEARVAPVVARINLTKREAIELMSLNPDFEITREREDWSI